MWRLAGLGLLLSCVLGLNHTENLRVFREAEVAQKQSGFLIDCFILPPRVAHNTAIVPWPYSHRHFNSTLQTNSPKKMYPPILVMWRPSKGSGSVEFLVSSSGPTREDWKTLKDWDMLENFVVNKQNKTERRRFNTPGDARLVALPSGELRIIYACTPKGEHFKMMYSDLQYSLRQNSLYVTMPFNYLYAKEEGERIPQKNWVPFKYSVGDVSMVFYIACISPHHILYPSPEGNATDVRSRWGWDVRTIPVITVAMTEAVGGGFPWGAQWGLPRGGTPPVLIDTPFGPRFLCFFHSSQNSLRPEPNSRVRTYFMGAYLFDPSPPFAVTHVSRVPIVPSLAYNRTEWPAQAWTYIDVVVFPEGAVLLDAQTVAVSMGHNDVRGMILLFNLSDYFFNHHLRSISSRVIIDRVSNAKISVSFS